MSDKIEAVESEEAALSRARGLSHKDGPRQPPRRVADLLRHRREAATATESPRPPK